MKMVNTLKTFFLMIALAVFAFADSWVEKPDIDFYAHPFVEDREDIPEYVSARAVSCADGMYVEFKGKKYAADIYNIKVSLDGGEKVICIIENGRASVMDYDRRGVMLFLAAVFISGILFLNMKTGLRSLAALSLSLVTVFFVYIPAVINGFSPFISGIVLCLLISLVTLLCVGNGLKKSVPAIAGTFGGIFSVAVISSVFLAAAKTGGFSEEQMQLLNYIAPLMKTALTDIKGVFMAGIVLASTGVIMDVAISISSALSSIKSANPRIEQGKLFRRGMNIGKDIIASMSSSLLFAYVGGSLFIILSRSFYTYSAAYLLNSEWLVIIIAQILSGTCGIVLTVPVTSRIASVMLSRKK